ncbi:hypothetical protein EDB85DRAFT_2133997 [Lactarius pseudohatsudake]|nr:hypothetical protein EDB85DRAFT_2133997 [Lactarius pseudohatsudake]
MTSIIKLNADNYPIESVTVFKSNKAEVVRVFDLSLQPGQSKIQISHLPGSIDTDSARVSGLGDAQLFDVVCSIGRGIEEIDPLSTSEKSALIKDRDALDNISGTMVDYSRTLVGDKTLRTTRNKLEEEILQLTRQINVLSSADERKQGKSDGEVTVAVVAKQATEIELKLTYHTLRDFRPPLLVQNATWSAAYELHATTDAGVPSPSVSLHYRARITQSTGEDWAGVALTLSTADMNLSTQSIPTLIPTKISPPKNPFNRFLPSTNGLLQPVAPKFLFPPPNAAQGLFGQSQPVAQLSSGAFGSAPQAGCGPHKRLGPLWRHSKTESCSAWPSIPLLLEARLGLPHRRKNQSCNRYPLPQTMDGKRDEPAPIAEPTAVVQESPLALTDGIPHQLAVAMLPFSATLQHVAAPKMRPVAYLHATVRNASDYRLLAGPVHTFVDDAFAARTALPHNVALGDTFHCTLGANPATRIRYARTSRRADKPLDAAAHAFSKQWASTAFTSRTTITNSHPFALRSLVLRDAVPVSEDGERVNVVLRRPAALADLEQGEELERKVQWCKSVDGKGGRKEGLFEWVVDVGANEEVTIETEWDIKAPVSLKWIESM